MMLQHVGSLIATERQNQAGSTDIVMLYMDTACRQSNRCNGNSGNAYPLRTIQGLRGTRTPPVQVFDETTRSISAIQGELGGSITFFQCSYEKCRLGWPEHGRDEALHKLVAAWHGLTLEVRHKVMELARSCPPVE